MVTMPDWINQPENRLREFLAYLDRHLPGTGRLFFSNTEIEFVDAVEVVLDCAIRSLEDDAACHHASSEIALSTMLTNLLRHSGIPCEKEAFRNGHVDIVVMHPRTLKYQYLGKCKIYAGVKRHCDGCDQLLNRYSTGRQARGFLLEFIRQPGMYELLWRLKCQFNKARPLRMQGAARDHGTIKGAFLTVHRHFTESDVEVLHLGCGVFRP